MIFQRELSRLVCAIQMMTRLSTPPIENFTLDLPTRASRYYPVAGWLVGATSAAIFVGASRLGSPLVAAVLSIGAGSLVTGGFHEDGLADTADGLWGGQTAERRLDIMKDSRIGTYGALALFVITSLRIAALSVLSPSRGACCLIFTHGVARAAPLLAMRFGRYVGDPTTAKLPHTDLHVTGFELGIAWSLALLPGLFLPLPSVGLSVLGAVGGTLFVARKASELIGGFTGDVLGCMEQLAEAVILVTCAWTQSGR